MTPPQDPTTSASPQRPPSGRWRQVVGGLARLPWRGRRHCSTATIRALVAEAAGCGEALLRFGTETDAEFTALAQGLSRLQDHLAEIGAESAALDDVLNDRDEARTFSAAHALCKSSVELVHSSLGVAHSVQTQMAVVDESLLRACATREQFRQSFLQFRTIAMGFRVESARLDTGSNGVFTNVAAAVSELDEKISKTTATAFERIEGLVGAAADEHVAIHRGEVTLHQQATSSIELVRTELEGLRAALAPCTDHSAAIAGLLRQAAPHTAAILHSLQFQDIVRQKLEHVVSGFHDIAGHARDRALDPVYLHRSARLQHAHLRTAREQIDNAGRAVTGGIQALLGLGEELNARLATMEEATLQALRECRVAELFEREIRHLARIADTSEDANRRIAELVERIGGVVRVFSQDIATHEREVKLVAINAQVAAARMDSAGALEKLAEETTRVSRRTGEITRALTVDLNTTLERLVGVKAEAEGFLAVITREKAMLEEGAGAVGARLAERTQFLQTRAAQMRHDFAAVQEQTKGLLASTAFAGLMAASFDPAEAMCNALAECTGSSADDELSADGVERLSAHRDRYTMHQERHAHAAILDGAAVPPAAEAAGAIPIPEAARAATAEVELFSDAPDPAVEKAAPASSEPESAAAKSTPAPSPPAPPAAAAAGDFGDGIELF